MHLRGQSTVLFFIVPLLVGVLVLSGCGGGGDQSQNGGSQNGGSGEERQGGAPQDNAPQGGAPQGSAPQAKIALGTVRSVKPDRRKIILRPSKEIQGSKRMDFKVRDDAEISLNDRPAEMADVKEGQRAQIEYVVKNEMNRARAVALIGNGEGAGG